MKLGSEIKCAESTCQNSFITTGGNHKYCKECAYIRDLACWKRYAEKNKEKVAETTRKWRENNKERFMEQQRVSARRRRKEHPDLSLVWRQANPDKVHVQYYKANRRIKRRYGDLVKRFQKFANIGRSGELISFEQYKVKIYTSNGQRQVCHYCGHEASETGTGIDRKNNSINYTDENSVCACRGCNVWKNSCRSYEETMLRFKPMRDAARLRIINETVMSG